MLSLLLANWKVLDSVSATAVEDEDDYVLDEAKASVKVFVCKRRAFTKE